MSAEQAFHLQFGVRPLDEPAEPASRQAHPRFRILVLSDLLGTATPSPGVVLPFPFDLQTLDSLAARLAPVLDLHLGERPLSQVTFSSMADFHPDQLYRRLELFQPIRQLRAQLNNPATASVAAEIVRSWHGRNTPSEAASPSGPSASMQEPAPPPATPQEDLERLLGRKPAEPPSPSKVEAFVRDVIASSVVPAPDPALGDLTAELDQIASGLLRAMLHHPVFRDLEASWAGLRFLAERLEADGAVELHALPFSRAQLRADLPGDAGWRGGTLAQLCLDEAIDTPGAQPWSLLVVDHIFEAAEEDLALLMRLLQLAQAAGAAVLAPAGPSFRPIALQPGACPATVCAAWDLVRRSPAASAGCLLHPRFLLRSPYGRRLEPVEALTFEEIEDPADPEGYLWGNPAFGLAALLGLAYLQGASESPDLELGDLPLHAFSTPDGRDDQTPCAEAWTTETEGRALLAAGVLPLLSIRGRNAARFLSLQSLSNPPSPLGGSWS